MAQAEKVQKRRHLAACELQRASAKHFLHCKEGQQGEPAALRMNAGLARQAALLLQVQAAAVYYPMTTEQVAGQAFKLPERLLILAMLATSKLLHGQLLGPVCNVSC